MWGDAVVTTVFALFTLLVLTGGAMRVAWVFLFDEYIGVATPPANAPPPARFEVIFARPASWSGVRSGHAPVQLMTPGR